MGPKEMWKTTLSLLTLFSIRVSCDYIPDLETFSQLSSSLEEKLLSTASQILRTKTASEAYSNSYDIKLVPVNGTKILEEVLTLADSFLLKKEQALKRLYEAAKDAEDNHEEDLTLTLRRVQFFNVKGSEAEEEGALMYIPSFGQNVSMNGSGVHIPLEIYEG